MAKPYVLMLRNCESIVWNAHGIHALAFRNQQNIFRPHEAALLELGYLYFKQFLKPWVLEL